MAKIHIVVSFSFEVALYCTVLHFTLLCSTYITVNALPDEPRKTGQKKDGDGKIAPVAYNCAVQTNSTNSTNSTI